MTIDPSQFAADAEVGAPSDADLSSIAELGAELLRVEHMIAQAERELKDWKEAREKLSRETIPAAMRELRLSSFQLEDGASVTVRPFVRAKIPVKDVAAAEAAFAWLRDNGHGDLIKHEVKALFGRGEDELAEAAKEDLTLRGVEYDEKQSVPWNTLTAQCEEWLEEGYDFPGELFGLFQGHETKIVPVKK